MPEAEVLLRIANNCSRLRAKRHYNVMKLSRASGISPRTIHRIFAGETGASIMMLATLADAMNVDIFEFFKQGE